MDDVAGWRPGYRIRLAAIDSRSKSFRAPLAPELLSLCVLKEKVTKEKEHPAWRLPGLLPGKSVSRGRAFRAGIVPARKGVAIPGNARCAACRPRLTAAQGTPVEQRAIVARTPQKSWSRAKTSALAQKYGQTFHHPSEMKAMWEWFWMAAFDPKQTVNPELQRQ